MTQSQLAKKLKISPSSIGMYEQGRRKPSSSLLKTICKELEADANYVLGLEDKNSDYLISHDVYNVISEFNNFIGTNENITLNGAPINSEDREKISRALKLATALVLSEYEDTTKSK